MNVQTVILALLVIADDRALHGCRQLRVARRCALRRTQVRRGGRRRRGGGRLCRFRRQRCRRRGRNRCRRSGTRRGHGGRGDRTGRGLSIRHGDQQILPFADRVIRSQTVPLGQRPDRDIVKPCDGKGCLTSLDLMPRRFLPDLRTGGGTGRRWRLGCGRDHATAGRRQRGRADRGRVRAVDGAAGQTGNIRARRLDRAEATRRGRRLGHAARQGHNLIGAQRIGGAQPVETGQFIRGNPDPGCDIGHGIALPRHGHLIVRIGNHTARIRGRAVRHRLPRRLGRVQRAAEIAAHVEIQRPVAGGQYSQGGSGQDQMAQRPLRRRARALHGTARGCAGSSGTALFGHLDFLCPAPCAGAWLLSVTPALGPARDHPSPVNRAPAPRPGARTAQGAARHTRNPSRDASRGSGSAPCRTVPPARP